MKNLGTLLMAFALILTGCGVGTETPAEFSAAELDQLAVSAAQSPEAEAEAGGLDGRGARGQNSSLTVDEKIIRALNWFYGGNPSVNWVNMGAASCTQGCAGTSYRVAARQYQKVNGVFVLVNQGKEGDLLPANASTISLSGGAFAGKASKTAIPTVLGAYVLAIAPSSSQPVGLAVGYYGPSGYGYCVYPGSCVAY